MRGDQIEVYKMIKGMDKVDVEWMLPLVGHSRTRGHSLRIILNRVEEKLVLPKGCESGIRYPKVRMLGQ